MAAWKTPCQDHQFSRVPIGNLRRLANAHAEFAIESARVYRHSTTGEYNSDWGIVHHNGGRVTKTEFSAD
jgi:hypothetical protein